MKKNLITILTLVLVASSLFASGFCNNQKIYSVDADIIDAITFLYLEQGHTVPSASAPYSKAEFLKMLDRLDVSRFDEAQKSLYDYVLEALDESVTEEDEGGVSFNWGLGLNLETYLHSNTGFNTREDWIRGFQAQKPFFAFNFETWPGNLFYGYFEGEVANNRNLTGGFGSKPLSTNVPLVPPNTFGDLSLNFPYRAFVAAGGDFWTLQLGRDRMNWGSGVTGNLFLGDNIKYHNMARATVFGNKFKYTFVSSFFPHPKSYIADGDGNCLSGDGQGTRLDGIYMFMAHRLEWRVWKDRLNLSLTEGVMYQSEENLLDLRVFNPAGFFHDYYIRANANSLLGLEAEFTPVRNLSLYAQAVVDEFALPGEPRPDESQYGFPQAMGFLGGVKYYKVLPGALALKVSFEAAKTDPFLYIRYSYGADGEGITSRSDKYGLGYVVAIREFGSEFGTRYNSSFLGYKYGCDALAFNLNAGLKRFGAWSVDTNFFYMLHGTHDMFTAWAVEGGADGVSPGISTPTNQHETFNYNDANAQRDRNAVSHTLVFGVHGSYIINRHFNAFAQLDYINIRNYKNISATRASDFQLTIGVSYIL